MESEKVIMSSLMFKTVPVSPSGAFAGSNLPDRLRLRDGVLGMADGSSVTAYLQDRQAASGYGSDEPMVLMPRKSVAKLVEDAEKWRLSQMIGDERYALAA